MLIWVQSFYLLAMHAVGIHSALAIKRQRKRRDEQKRAKERRYSIQSSESGDTQHSPHGSTRRKYRHHVGHTAGNGMLDTKVSLIAARSSGLVLFLIKTQNNNILAIIKIEMFDIIILKVVTSIGMLHIGVVFLVFGVFLLGAGILPDDISQWNFFGRYIHSMLLKTLSL